ncbi:fumarylacetoacetase [Marivita hallyeonensis]|uniref:fumarylacetoacetase n=1 Tax=Marivita hallyeonensis TaxID=996342 RepID=A0A1M5LMW3_9RHOB|nr:fumarylacetoacetase [Marivita hallyeonensis]SHG66417.1 fumarylacetoacetate hydrolase [Marivita hallyeonensis]
MTGRLDSWVASANTPETDFPLNNLPYGTMRHESGQLHACVAIGDQALDVTAMAKDGFLDLPEEVFRSGVWNDFMALGPKTWQSFRDYLSGALSAGSDQKERLAPYLSPLETARLELPFTVTEYTDFYSSRHHAFNVGSLFRGPENALPPNWLHMPIGYNGRASSVVVSGTDIVRPHGQLKRPDEEMPVFAPSERFDFELELGAIVGQPSSGPVSVQQADDMIFGYVLLNDWSARDIQAWEYQPLGPFQAKATATTISPWIVTKDALEPFRTSTPAREKALLPHLRDAGPMLYDIKLEVGLAPMARAETVISRTNYSQMYYSAAQQLAHHASSGCPMRVGDLLGSGTISGPREDSRGSLLELSWSGQQPLSLTTGETRTFLEDGDTVTLRGAAVAADHRIGFGECRGTLRPARA